MERKNAHKMGRKWVMIEREQCNVRLIESRLNSVVSGEDQGGISQSVGWRGGGSFLSLPT